MQKVYIIEEILDYHDNSNYLIFLDKIKALEIYNAKIDKAKKLKLGFENDIKFIEKVYYA